MIDELKAIAIFAETIKQGSFRRAAEKLSLSPSVVSYHVSQLEDHLGTALIYRSTRKLSLTSEGHVLYEHAIKMLASAEQGLAEAGHSNHVFKGALSLTVPTALIHSPFNEFIAEFHEQHVGVALNISYTDSREDLIAEGIDLAIRAGKMQDSALKAKRIGQLRRRLVCSPAYFVKQERPRHPKDLANWNWIHLDMMPLQRTFRKAGRQSVTVDCQSAVRVNSVVAMAQLCANGMGLATPSDSLVIDDLKSGRLMEPLPGWAQEPIPLYAVWPANVPNEGSVKRFVAALADSRLFAP